MAVGNMIRVLKGNKEMLVSPVKKAYYLDAGYAVIDEDGKILEQKETEEAKLAAALAENTKLKAELAKAKKPKKVEKAEE